MTKLALTVFTKGIDKGRKHIAILK